LMYAVHLVFCAVSIWLKYQLRPARAALVTWASGLGLVLATSALSWNWR